jgi:3-dehydroquinate dehydratase-1
MNKLALLLQQDVPLICVPIMGKTEYELYHHVSMLSENRIKPDVVEWRADHLLQLSPVDVNGHIERLRTIIGSETAFLFTYRSSSERGMGTDDESKRIDIIQRAIASDLIDVVDIEGQTDNVARQEVIDAAHQKDVNVIVSAHDFVGMPADIRIAEWFEDLIDSGGDLAKLAVTASNSLDTLRFLQMQSRIAGRSLIPLIGIVMGAVGTITRLAGPFYGSCLSFASIGTESAPGQLPIDFVREYWASVGLRPLNSDL